MSFSGGTFSINTSGQPVVTGTTISSSVFNALTADLATGLSTCMLKDGTQTATAGIGFYAGTVSLPGIYLGTDTATGWYRVGLNDWGFTVNTTKTLDLANGISVTSGKLSGTTAGALNLARSTVQQNAILFGYRALTDNTATDLIDVTMITGAGNDDSISLVLDYYVTSQTGGTRSAERGQVSFEVGQEGTPTITAGTPTKYGNSQVVIGGGTYVIAFTSATASNVVTLRITATRSTGSDSVVAFNCYALGGIRSGTSIALDAGVTAGT